MDKAQHRAEDLGFSQLARGGNAIENSWLHEVTSLMLWNPRVAAVQQDFRSLLHASGDQRLDPCLALRCDHGAHLHALVEPVAYPQRRGGLGNRVTKSFLCFTNRHCHGDGQAALPGAAEGAVADDLRGHLHVSVWQNNDMVLGAALALRSLSVLTGARI